MKLVPFLSKVHMHVSHRPSKVSVDAVGGSRVKLGER